MDLIYFDIQHAIEVHDEIIRKSGGVMGLLNIGLLEASLEHIKNDVYYPTIQEKLTHLFYSVNKNHSFNDGNKRASIALSAYFLEINNLDFLVLKFIKRMEDVTVHVASNLISKDLLYEIISSILYEEDYNEELKLKIYYALS
ncbi:type II toxin-antitoxin system death-on-curing family toxin [Pontibacter arcticus]|uniref:Type II toxin-antitoxin system death-on-curing family toxin n=1 Tax=Pontibacter arcticus TaxID=2080288 RepID=A0A364RHH0_9BACT|nr:type II toxin-antitoxin system death-on-curing family toxin [Pontibacter arcticus]RAU83732.1 type II toxin-antitoxin system death-on-curing family toxin [Pontibacter arcticus]